MDDRETFWSKQAEKISWFNKLPAVFDYDFKICKMKKEIINTVVP